MPIPQAAPKKLTLHSDKPQAHAFQDWMTRIVLSSIRKNGGYIAGQEQVASGAMTDMEFLAKAKVVALPNMAPNATMWRPATGPGRSPAARLPASRQGAPAHVLN